MVVQAGSDDHALTPLARGQGSTERFRLTSGVLVTGEALVIFIQSIAVVATGSVSFLDIAQLAQVPRMVCNLVAIFLARVIILLASKERWHTRNDVIVIGMVTGINHGV